MVPHGRAGSECFGERDIIADATEDPGAAEVPQELRQDMPLHVGAHVHLDGNDGDHNFGS